ncbi:Protein kinase superfamily protein [Prunus dulcis]|uniref:Protein kinase superfamily protein n=1 Tax=Prunus dulcis TaxID=3755 RepID=A0A5H2XMU5_PRUDU|nr:Protein kinase superfamily protein [Prunus dulcis]
MALLFLQNRSCYKQYDRTRPDFHFGIRVKSCACPTPGKCRAQMTFLPFSFQKLFKISLRLSAENSAESPLVPRTFPQNSTLLSGAEAMNGPVVDPAHFYGLGAENRLKMSRAYAVYPSRKLAKSGDYGQPDPPAGLGDTESAEPQSWQVSDTKSA